MKMKISVFFLPFFLLIILTGDYVLKSCRKDVDEIYNYESVTFTPDFTITKGNFTVDNEALNSESILSFTVTYKNKEVTKVRYGTIICFYVDGEFLESSIIQDIEANKDYEQLFTWKALSGKHDFTFQINISSDSALIILEEKNIANNSYRTSIDIPIKELNVLQSLEIDASIIAKSVENDAISGISEVMTEKKMRISTKGRALSTIYESNVTTFAAAIESEDGIIDSTRFLISISYLDDQSDLLTANALLEINKEKGEVLLYDKYYKIAYNKGGATLIYLKNKSSCTEPWFWECAGLGATAVACILGILASPTGVGLAAAIAACVASVGAGYLCYMALKDNDPTISENYTRDGPVCKECIDEKTAQDFYYLAVKLSFTDDRGPVIFSTDFIKGGCKPSSAIVSATDCGGHTVKKTFFTKYVQLRMYSDLTCGHKGGAGG
jgi:hypothetical protein